MPRIEITAFISKEFVNAASPDLLAHQTALEALFRRHHRQLIRFFVRRRATLDEASDMAQEVYCRMAARAGVAALEYPRAFLFRTADNLLKDRARQQRAHRVVDHVPLENESKELLVESASQEQLLTDQQELALLRAAILELSPRCQQVFLLHRLGHMSYPEIARHCGISVSMVEKHISKALAFCRSKVRGEAT